jgi:hypothetical protein
MWTVESENPSIDTILVKGVLVLPEYLDDLGGVHPQTWGY